MKFLIQALATGFGIGFSPVLPGSIATLLGCALWWLIKDLPPGLYLLLIIGLFFPGARIATASEKIFKKKDPSQIVIDEILAFPLAMFLVSVRPDTIILGYVLFRAYDIFKPFPCRRLEHLPQGYGIMADDYAAAIYACLTLHGLTFLVHQF